MSRGTAEELLNAFTTCDSRRICERLNMAKAQVKRESIELAAVPLLCSAVSQGLAYQELSVLGQSLSLCHGIIRRLALQDRSLLQPMASYLVSRIGEHLANTDEKVLRYTKDCLHCCFKECPEDVERFLHEVLMRSSNTDARLQAVKVAIMIIRADLPKAKSVLHILHRARDDSAICVQRIAVEALCPAKRTDMTNSSRDGEMIAQDLDPLREHHQREVKDRVGRSVIEDADRQIRRSSLIDMAGTEMEQLEPVMVHTPREVETEIASMIPAFEGKETEKNWMTREKYISHLRSLLRGNAVTDFPMVLLTNLRLVLDGILKTMASLRTSLCLASLQLVKDMAIVFGSQLEGIAETLLISLIRLTALTKKIASNAANVSVSVLLHRSQVWPRLVQQVIQTTTDKNVSPRLYAAGWVRILIETHRTRAIADPAFADTIEKGIKRLLTDANAAVRDAARLCFGDFAYTWPDKAKVVLASLDSTARKQVQRTLDATSHTSLDRLHASVPERVQSPPETLATQACSDRYVSDKGRGLDRLRVKPEGSRPTGHVGQTAAAGGIPARVGLGSAMRQPQRPRLMAEPTIQVTAVPAHFRNHEASTLPSKCSSESSEIIAPNTKPPESTIHQESTKGKVTLIDLLEHDDEHKRLEGVIVLQTLLRNAESHQDLALPDKQTLTSLICKLLADPQTSVWLALIEFDVLQNISEYVEWGVILLRLLLGHESGDDSRCAAALTRVQRSFSTNTAISVCCDILALMRVTGHLTRPMKHCYRFDADQKRLIIRGVLHWLIGLVKGPDTTHSDHLESHPPFADSDSYMLVLARMTDMMGNVQSSSINYAPLKRILQMLQAMQPEQFSRYVESLDASLSESIRQAVEHSPVVPVLSAGTPSGSVVRSSDESVDDGVPDTESSCSSDLSGIDADLLDMTIVNLARLPLADKAVNGSVRSFNPQRAMQVVSEPCDKENGESAGSWKPRLSCKSRRSMEIPCLMRSMPEKLALCKHVSASMSLLLGTRSAKLEQTSPAIQFALEKLNRGEEFSSDELQSLLCHAQEPHHAQDVLQASHGFYSANLAHSEKHAGLMSLLLNAALPHLPRDATVLRNLLNLNFCTPPDRMSHIKLLQLAMMLEVQRSIPSSEAFRITYEHLCDLSARATISVTSMTCTLELMVVAILDMSLSCLASNRERICDAVSRSFNVEARLDGSKMLVKAEFRRAALSLLLASSHAKPVDTAMDIDLSADHRALLRHYCQHVHND
ncbi:suppressor of tub2 mutation [Savitreella phatthalungensis]